MPPSSLGLADIPAFLLASRLTRAMRGLSAMSAPSVFSLLESATAFRRTLPGLAPAPGSGAGEPSSTTAFRVADGAGDHLPGLEIDSYDGHWVVQTRDTPLPGSLRRTLPAGCRSLWWKRLDQQDKQAPQPVLGDPPPQPFTVRELDLLYEIDLSAGYSQGLFLDQRPQRARLMERVQPGRKILNLFAYTCAFSVAAASRGAVTTSVDLSRPYLDWGRRNFHHNGLDPAVHFFCRGDSFEWLRRFAGKSRAWDGIVVDPPTFSRNADGRVFRAGQDFPELIRLCLAVLNPGGWILASTNHRGISPDRFRSMVEEGARAAGRPFRRLTAGRMPPDFTDEPYLKSLWAET